MLVRRASPSAFGVDKEPQHHPATRAQKAAQNVVVPMLARAFCRLTEVQGQETTTDVHSDSYSPRVLESL